MVKVEATGPHLVPAADRLRILLHTVHDGDGLPPAYVHDAAGRFRVDEQLLERRFIEERDWGANLVAGEAAAAMGVPGYARCRVARVLIDFNRFPGSTPGDAHVPVLERLAISHPFSEVLDHAEKMRLLEEHYDPISDFFEMELLAGKLIMIAVHTYDEHNPSRTRRPHCSVLTSMAGYQRDSRMPFGVFDPMYPDLLGETTCNRILRDRVSLHLERAGFRVAHNYPYLLPEGSLEVRAQVWFFFWWVRQRFEDARPETCDDPNYRLIWKMLLNTNLRDHDAVALKGFLHRYRKPPPEEVDRFRAGQRAYQEIRRFIEEKSLTNDFRHAKERPSSFGLEVRKDLLVTFDQGSGRPLPMTEAQRERAREVGSTLAEAIRIYLETDRIYLDNSPQHQ
jgi:N-formylglutamate amidohydrolase